MMGGRKKSKQRGDSKENRDDEAKYRVERDEEGKKVFRKGNQK